MGLRGEGDDDADQGLRALVLKAIEKGWLTL
jgi:hypothetical protein